MIDRAKCPDCGVIFIYNRKARPRVRCRQCAKRRKYQGIPDRDIQFQS